MDGRIKLHRQIVEWEWFTKPNHFLLFSYFLILANHKEKKRQGITITRGSFITSLQNISLSTHVSIRCIRTTLENLKKSGEIVIETTSRYTMITIVNYGLYNDGEIETDKPTTNKGQTSDKQTTTTKNVNNVKNNISTNVDTPSGEVLIKDEFGNKDITDVVNFIKEKCAEYGIAYKSDGQDRNFAKHLLSKKFAEETLAPMNITLNQFMDGVLKVSMRIKGGYVINNTKSMYQKGPDNVVKWKQQQGNSSQNIEKPIYNLS